MTDVGFVIAGYGVILGGLAIYAYTLRRRLAALRHVSLRIRSEANAAPDTTPAVASRRDEAP